MPRRCLKLLQIGTLVALLVAAQTAALAHAERFDAHPPGDACVLCVGLSSLGAGNVAAPLFIDAIVAPAAVVDRSFALTASRRPGRPSARGPPQAS